MQPKCREYKYNIIHLLNKLPKEDYDQAKRNLYKLCETGKSTFDKYLYIKKDSKKEIPSNVLLTISTFLNVTPMELYNKEIRTATIDELKNL